MTPPPLPAVLSFDPHQTLDQEVKSVHHAAADAATSSGLTLELHSRDFIPTTAQPHPTDYKTLTLDRLRHDFAQVKSIAAQLALAAHSVKRSDLKPVAEEKEFTVSAEDIRGPIISGTSQGSGEYSPSTSSASAAAAPSPSVASASPPVSPSPWSLPRGPRERETERDGGWGKGPVGCTYLGGGDRRRRRRRRAPMER